MTCTNVESLIPPLAAFAELHATMADPATARTDAAETTRTVLNPMPDCWDIPVTLARTGVNIFCN